MQIEDLPLLITHFLPCARGQTASTALDGFDFIRVVDRQQRGADTARLSTGFELTVCLALALSVRILGRRNATVAAVFSRLVDEQLDDQQQETQDGFG